LHTEPLKAVCAALVRDGKVLLGKRSKDKAFDPLKWSLFGGHIKPRETHDDAIRRELREELGIEVDEVEPIGTLPEIDEKLRYVTDVYIVTKWRGEPQNLQEHDEIRWVAPEDFGAFDLSPGLVAIEEQLGLFDAIRRLTRGTRTPRSRRKSLATNLSVLIVASLATLAAMEGVLRYMNKPMLLVCGWKSDSIASELNQLGYRGHPIQYSDADHVIVLLGDSHVQANACSYDWMPERRLERDLRRAGHQVRVCSIASFGYGQDQQLLALREYFAHYRADTVLLWQTPVNDVWNNTFPTLMPDICPPKPTFRLEGDKLCAPTAAIGARLERFHLQALWRRVFGTGTNDAWEARLPRPYQMLAGYDGPVDGTWQQHWDRNYGMIQLERLDRDKHHWSMYLTPRSPRMQYGLDLTRRLMHEIESLTRAHGARFAVFRVEFPSPPGAVRAIHDERVYALNGKYYRASGRQFRENVAYLQKGFKSFEVAVATEKWRVGPEDAHLNEHATDEVMGKVAAKMGAILADTRGLPGTVGPPTVPHGCF